MFSNDECNNNNIREPILCPQKWKYWNKAENKMIEDKNIFLSCVDKGTFIQTVEF